MEKAIKTNALNSGLILGIISFVFSIISFYVITSTTSVVMIFLGPVLFSIILPIVVSVFITLDLRKKIGGYWTFRQATTGAFIMFFVSYLLSTILNYGIFSKFIEPNMVQKTETAMVNAVTSMMEKQNIDQDKIDQKTADIEKNFEDQKHPTIGKTAKGVVIAIIFTFVISLIYGAIFKKEKPLFDAPVSETP